MFNMGNLAMPFAYDNWNNELERIWKEVFLVDFKTTSPLFSRAVAFNLGYAYSRGYSKITHTTT
jgi:hypothetical protein